jgi:Holliday junction resolvase
MVYGQGTEKTVTTLKPERKFWLELKEKTPNIIWNRIENLALPGIPDLLGYNKNHLFFTVELKVVKSRKVRLSPHQIAFHVKHPENSFILVKPLASRDWKLYEGKESWSSLLAACCLKLAARGLKLAARCLKL